MGKINSKQKGKSAELELVHYLKDKGYECRRTAQYCGMTGDASDITGLELIHPEVKHVERLNIEVAMQQAIRDSTGSTNIPCVFHRRNRTKWLVTMELDNWLIFYKALLQNACTGQKTSKNKEIKKGKL